MEEIIRQIINREISLTIDVAKVVKVKGDVCHVESLTNEKDFFKCRLNAIEINENDKLKITPSEGSTVIIGIFRGTEKAVILKPSKVDKIEFAKGNTKFSIDETGYNINRNGKNLKDVLNTLIDKMISQNTQTQTLTSIVSAIVVLQGTGPNPQAISTLNQQLTQLMMQTNTQLRSDLNQILIPDNE